MAALRTKVADGAAQSQQITDESTIHHLLSLQQCIYAEYLNDCGSQPDAQNISLQQTCCNSCLPVHKA